MSDEYVTYEIPDMQPEGEGEGCDEQPDDLRTRPLPAYDTQPMQSPSPDDVETGELPGDLGEPTISMEFGERMRTAILTLV